MSTGLEHTITQVIERLGRPKSDHYAIIGIDGFVDKIQQPVEFQDHHGSNYFQTLDGFGGRIQRAAGQSAQIELHTKTIKLGGNAPIFANALAQLGVRNTCLGTFGYPEVHPVFQDMHTDCELISLGDAAETNALEFDDGKLILSELSIFKDLNWSKVKKLVGLDRLRQLASRAQLIGLVDWCNLPHATDIWTGFFQEVIQESVTSEPHFFFDLADPTKKSDQEIQLVISIINQFAEYGQVTFGLNQNEATKLAQFFSRQTGESIEINDLLELGLFLKQQLSIDQLLIHPLDGCYLIDKNGACYLDGRIVKQPAVSTGGGDNFNAGFCFGMLNGYNKKEAMVLAMATSGAYVQQGNSPTQEEVKNYLLNWMSE